MITDTKVQIRPLVYDWAETFWEMSERSPWWHKSINMQSAKLDWEVSLSLREKNVMCLPPDETFSTWQTFLISWTRRSTRK
jgi:ribonucleotide reductase beta subunit family protein with ferritin-like domain